MKRIIKILFTVVLLFAYESVFSAYAVTDDDNLVFDLNLSEYQTSGMVSDKSGSNIEVASTAIKPLAGTVTYNNITTPYVVFNNEQNDISSGFYLSDSRLLNLPDITVEAWANPNKVADGDSNERVIFSVSKRYSDSTLISVFKNNYCDFYADKTQNIGQSTDVSEQSGSWNHYVFTRSIIRGDGNNSVKYCTYINGNLMAESTNNPEIITDETEKLFFIGLPSKLSDAANVFRGKLSEFRIYTKALSNDEVLDNYFAQYSSYKELIIDDPSEPDTNDGKLFCLDMESYNQTAAGLKDTSGNIPGLTFSAEAPMKNYYNSVRGQTPYITFYQETNQAIVFPADTIKNKPVLTAEMWLRYENFIDRWQHSFGLYSKTSGFSPETFSDKGAPMISFGGRFNVTDLSGMWVHFVYTRIYDENAKTIEYKTYINGSLKGDITVTNASLNEGNFDRFYIGTGGLGSDKNNQYTGDMAKFVLYNKELSEEKIKEVYNQEKSNFDKAYFYTEDNAIILSDDEKIIFSVDGDVDMGKLSASDFSLICKQDNTEVRCHMEKDTQLRKIILYPDEYLKEGASYRLTLDSVQLADKSIISSAYYDFTTKKCDIMSEIFWFNQNNDIISTLKNVTQLRSQVVLTNSADREKTCSIILISYNDKGQAVSADLKEVMVSAGGFKKELLAVDCGDNISKVYLYIFDVTNGAPAPIQNTVFKITK